MDSINFIKTGELSPLNHYYKIICSRTSFLIISFFVFSIYVSGCGRKVEKTTHKVGICDEISANDCFNKGKLLEKNGDGRFLEYYEKACDNGNLLSCNYLTGILYQLKDNTQKNDAIYKKIILISEKLCKKNQKWACELKFQTFSPEKEKKKKQIVKALAYYEDQCKNKDVSFCKKLIDLLVVYRSVESKKIYKDVSIQTNNLACSKGYAQGCYNLGYGNFILGNYKSSFKYYEKACKLGLYYSCGEYIRKTISAVVLGKNGYANLYKGLKNICDYGYSDACLLFARGAYNGWWGKTSQHLNVISVLQKSCQNGFGESCIFLSKLYTEGFNTKVDKKKAILILQKSCSEGYNNSCATLAESTRNGGLGKPNIQSAVSIAKNYCKSTNTRTNYRYRRQFYDSYYYYKSPSCGIFGYYVTLGYTNVISKYYGERYLENACNLGYQNFCYLLGQYYLKNNYSSYRYINKFKKYCNSGYGEGCFALESIYTSGKKVSKSKSKVKFFHEKACRLLPKDKRCN